MNIEHLRTKPFSRNVLQLQKNFARNRTRTCNPQIRSLVPSPLGHTSSYVGWNQCRLRISISTRHVATNIYLACCDLCLVPSPLGHTSLYVGWNRRWISNLKFTVTCCNYTSLTDCDVGSPFSIALYYISLISGLEI